MLSFLGAIHWGLEFGKFGGSHGHPRCVPSLPVHFFRTASHEPDEELLFVLLVGRLRLGSRSEFCLLRTPGRRSTCSTRRRRSSLSGLGSSLRGVWTDGPVPTAGVRSFPPLLLFLPSLPQIESQTLTHNILRF